MKLRRSSAASATKSETPFSEIFATILAGVAGLILGSFATAVAYRVPRRLSFAGTRDRSRCPSCGATLSAAENIPLVSYVVQRGRCKSCRARISPHYPVTELVTALLLAGAVMRFGPSVEAAVFGMFFWALVVLTIIDIEYKLLPNRIVYPMFVAGWAGLAIVVLVDGDPERLVRAGIGALIFGGFFFVVALIVPRGMGGGDVKLAFVLGTFLGFAGGPGVVLVGMFLSFLLGAVIGLVIAKLTGGDRKTKVPFGPFLALGTVLGVLFGSAILDAYLGSLT